MSINAAIKTMMESDVTATQSDWSATLTYKGSTTVGTFSPIQGGNELDADGILTQLGAEFVAVKSLFAVVPPERAVVDIDGTKYAVLSVTDDTAAISLRLERREDKTSTGGIL